MNRNGSETFALEDEASIKRLSRNAIGEENSAAAYYWFTMKYLISKGGVVEQADLEAALLRHYGETFGPEDVRRIKTRGKGSMPKWRNTLAWAKVMGRSLWQLDDGSVTPLFLQRSRTENKQRKTYIVLIDDDVTPAYWIEWVAGRKRPKNGFTKRCKECKARNRLAAVHCYYCGKPFPEAAKRIHRLPR